MKWKKKKKPHQTTVTNEQTSKVLGSQAECHKICIYVRATTSLGEEEEEKKNANLSLIPLIR